MQLRYRTPRPAAFTLMEILVVVAIIVVLSSIAYPIYGHFKRKANKVTALASIKQLSEGLLSYTASNADVLPSEDLDGKDNWNNVKKQPEADKVWYNAVVKHLGKTTAGDFGRADNPAGFYTKENILFLPGAQYPEDTQKSRPFFAIAFNSRLARATTPGAPVTVKLGDIVNKNRTVMFMEQGLPGEPKAHETITKKDYDGAPKGSAKSFVTRYSGKEGLISFFNGSVEPVKATSILTVTGAIAWSPEVASDPSAIIWTTDPKINPNAKTTP